jgi:hypothetical protein
MQLCHIAYDQYSYPYPIQLEVYSPMHNSLGAVRAGLYSCALLRRTSAVDVVGQASAKNYKVGGFATPPALLNAGFACPKETRTWLLTDISLSI